MLTVLRPIGITEPAISWVYVVVADPTTITDCQQHCSYAKLRPDGLPQFGVVVNPGDVILGAMWIHETWTPGGGPHRVQRDASTVFTHATAMKVAGCEILNQGAVNSVTVEFVDPTQPVTSKPTLRIIVSDVVFRVLTLSQ